MNFIYRSEYTQINITFPVLENQIQLNVSRFHNISNLTKKTHPSPQTKPRSDIHGLVVMVTFHSCLSCVPVASWNWQHQSRGSWLDCSHCMRQTCGAWTRTRSPPTVSLCGNKTATYQTTTSDNLCTIWVRISMLDINLRTIN